MDPIPAETPATSLGQRLRQARLARGLSQEALASPEFTKGYISALERGAIQPSLRALEVLARRLDLPATSLIAAPALVTAPDWSAVEENLHYDLNYANMLIH